jgi:hypothetical protein
MPINFVSCTDVKPSALLDDERTEDEITATEDDDRIDDTDERTDDEDEERMDDDERTEDGTDETLDLLVDTDEDVTPPQTAPVTAGVSIAPPLAFTCKPKTAVCPGWIFPFQLKLLAL